MLVFEPVSSSHSSVESRETVSNDSATVPTLGAFSGEGVALVDILATTWHERS